MLQNRILKEYEACIDHKNAIIGCQFKRIPEDSTRHYTNWCNNLTEEELYLQQYREITLIQPTWFMEKKTFMDIGGYVEDGKCEDLIFFHKHLDNNGKLYLVKEILLIYRYHTDSLCHITPRRMLERIRLQALERRVLNKWDKFSVWGAGRDGKNFVNDLTPENQKKIVCFCDVDDKKIGKDYFNSYTGLKLPIIHWSKVKPPFICCVAMNRTSILLILLYLL